MAKQKFDGVIDAVHYNPDGQVKWVRAYLRRGATFTDNLLIQRQDLVEEIRSGKNSSPASVFLCWQAHLRSARLCDWLKATGIRFCWLAKRTPHRIILKTSRLFDRKIYQQRNRKVRTPVFGFAGSPQDYPRWTIIPRRAFARRQD